MMITQHNTIGNLVGIWAELTEPMVLAGRGPADLHHGRIKGRGVLVPGAGRYSRPDAQARNPARLFSGSTIRKIHFKTPSGA